MRYKIYADRVESYVPIWREKVRLKRRGTVSGGVMNNYYTLPTKLDLKGAYSGTATCGCGTAHVAGVPVGAEKLSVSDRPIENPDEVVDDPSVSFRSMSKEALLAEAKTKEHLASHFPFNPYCPICRISCMKQSGMGEPRAGGRCG